MKLVLLLVALCQAAAPVRLSPSFMSKVLARLEAAPATASLAAQYRASPIPIFLRPSQPAEYRLNGAAAVYNPDRTIDLNSDVFGADPAPAEVAPTIGHELKHWRTHVAFGDAASFENELEAHHVQALNILEHVKADPSYFDGRSGPRKEVDYDLAEAWLGGPKTFIPYVRGRYLKHASVFDDEAARREDLSRDLETWTRQRERRDETLAELAAAQKEAERLERHLAPERVGGPSRSRALARMVAEFPTVQAMDRVIAELEWSLKFWSDPALLGAARAHYAAFLQELSAYDRSGYGLPARPTLAARLRAWLRGVLG